MPKKYKNYIGFKSIFYFCSLPLRLDSYRGCSHGCLYCFSQRLNNRRSRFFIKGIPADHNDFKRLMDLIEDDRKEVSLVRSCLQRRIPIHLGCLSDPLQPVELEHRITLNFLSILYKKNYPCIISTKSNLIARSEYLSAVINADAVVQMSFSTFDDDLARRIEPFAASPSDRLFTLKHLSKAGVWTVARLQPFLYPKEKLSLKIFERFAESGVKHIVLEHLRIPTNSRIKVRNALWRALGMNMLQIYRDIGIRHSRVNYELSSERKLENVLMAKEMANKLGMSFGSGDNDFHHFSDQLCCCGLPDKQKFAKIYTGHLGRGAYNAIQTGKVSYDYLEKVWQPEGGARQYINSQCRLAKMTRIIDLLKDRLCKPRSSNSPVSFYGIQWQANGKYSLDNQLRSKLKIGGLNDGKRRFKPV